jgi:acetyl esterase/lipase
MIIKMNSKNYIDLNLIDNQKRDVVLIFPGGGYEHTSKRESIPVSNVFLDDGYHTAIYYYREEKLIYPDIKEEGLKLIQKLRENLLFGRIFLIGFSAGGHFAAMLATSYNQLIDGTILAYPVISSDPLIRHSGSIHNLLGSNLNEITLEEVSLEKQVSNQMSPVFIMHTMDDQSVPVENSLRFIEALKNHQIYSESHFYPIGLHGLSLATKEVAFDHMDQDDFVNQFGYIAPWIELAKDFLRRIKK